MDAISKKINMKNFITAALLLCSALAYGQTVYVASIAPRVIRRLRTRAIRKTNSSNR